MPNLLDIDGSAFRDRAGRHVLLRGVNFGGDSKVPATPNGHSYLPSDFSDHRTVSFVGRPAPLGELDGHLDRLTHWGFNCLRLLTTWEAVEHGGPGQYDEAYLDYFGEVCRRASDRGFHIFIDFHQDVWSRMSGGDGAPGWTFEAAGLDFTRFDATDAANVMQHRYDPALGGRQDSYPVMSWGGNYAQPANGVMWTLFFAGADFAPTAKVGDESIQTWLQDHYLGAMRAVAERVAEIDGVIGFDTLNEPGTGYLGRALEEPLLRGQGKLWTPLAGLAVASGASIDLPVIEIGKGVVGLSRVNPDGQSIWLDGFEDPFRAAGAWELSDDGKPVALRPDFFRTINGAAVDLERDYMAPFFTRVAETIRAIKPDWLVFAELDPFAAMQGHGFPQGCPERTVNASHWYDLTALVTKRFSQDRMVGILSGTVREGPAAIEAGYLADLSILKRAGDGLNGGAPTLIGECGVAFDMNDADAFAAWAGGARDPSIWSAQSKALELMYNAMDSLLISSTQWNYTVTNRNDAMVGDGWNQEDLSIWSADQVTDPSDPDSGGRALEGFCRPYVRAAQGRLVSQAFDRETGRFEATVDIDSAIDAPTEIYVPALQYPHGFTMEGGPGSAKLEGQFVRLTAASSGPLRLVVARKPAAA